MKIQAIKTRYGGIEFESRLEARWAIYFDAMGWLWEYEEDWYRLPDGTAYLPDFLVRSAGWVGLAEVKPQGGDFSKANALSCRLPYGIDGVLRCEGFPGSTRGRPIDGRCGRYASGTVVLLSKEVAWPTPCDPLGPAGEVGPGAGEGAARIKWAADIANNWKFDPNRSHRNPWNGGIA